MIIPWRRETNDNVDHMWDHRETREADTGELIEGQHLLTEVQVGDPSQTPPTTSILLTSGDNKTTYYRSPTSLLATTGPSAS